MDALAELGVVPKDAAKAVWERGKFDVERIDEIEREVKHDVIAFLTHLAEFIGPDARFVHQGMTSSDVLDTCLSVQLVRATDLLLKEYPNLNRADEREAIDSLMSYAYNANTNSNGWGAMDRAVWQDQINQYAELNQFTKRVPKVEEVMTMDILNATREYRLRNS